MKPQAGITVIEVIMVIFITAVIMVILSRVMAAGYPVSRIVYGQARSAQTARIQLKRMSKALREARYSDAGAYPLVEMGPQKIRFYSNIDADAATELIRYELVGTDLIQGITEPAGNPLEYDPDQDEVEVKVAAYLQNGATDIFTYYNGDYPADPTPLTPIDLTEVKYIQFFLTIDVDITQEPDAIEVLSQVQLRNLKDNLSQQTP